MRSQSISLALLVQATVTLAAGYNVVYKRQTDDIVVPTVNTSIGLVSGHKALIATNVSEYLGIPYAQPPVGGLRFAPPEKYTGLSSINGTSFGFSCPANPAVSPQGSGTLNLGGSNLTAAGFSILGTLAQLSDTFSEDCLTLNIWVPSGGEEKKAVLIWIYGGSFATGSSSTPTYNGQHLADQEDVIVVSFNYRLNIFGFPGNPTSTHLNFGLLDQRLAIEWVRDNIAFFKGDTSRITLFGQSAGSASIDYYSYAYANDPIVAGLILESGTVNGFGQSSAADAAEDWFNVTSKLECGDATFDANLVLECMRTKETSSILSALPPSSAAHTNMSRFGPAIDNLTVFADYPSLSTAGKFSKIPLLIGSTDYEAGLFATIGALSNITLPHSYWVAFTSQVFTCPAAIRANISIAHGVPTWRYRWFGSFPDTQLTTYPNSGAWHASELPLLFGTLPSVAEEGDPESPVVADEAAIGRYIRAAWAAFAKDPVGGLGKYDGGWPTYDPATDSLVRLAWQNKTGVNAALPDVYDASCGVAFAVNDTKGGDNSANGLDSGSGSTTSVSSGLPTKSTAAVKNSAARGSSEGFLWIAITVAGGIICLY